MASDLPLFNNDVIIKLISERDISKIATAYASPVNGNPEPLAAIWEPKSYPVLLEALSKGLNCPRKLLMNNDIKLIKANDPDTLKNINTPEDLNSVLQIIKSKETAEHEC